MRFGTEMLLILLISNSSWKQRNGLLLETAEISLPAFSSAVHKGSGGCSFSAKDIGKLEQHVLFSRISENYPKEEKESLFKCRKAGCRETFKSVTACNRHEQDHDFVPQQCSRGRTDGKWFTTTGTWKYHVAHAHDDLCDTSTNLCSS